MEVTGQLNAPAALPPESFQKYTEAAYFIAMIMKLKVIYHHDQTL